MTTRIRDLPPPIPEIDENESTNTWDSTYRNHQQQFLGGDLLCPYAVAQDQYVWGLNNNDASFATIWQAKFDGFVSNIKSNSSGSVMAVATETGKVFLLNSSGKILANRDFRSSKTRFVWISDSILLIEITKSNPTNETEDSLLDNQNDYALSLVSNIQGDLLNSQDDAVVAEASRAMHIQVLTALSDHQGWPVVTGVVMEGAPHTIRFVGCQDDNDDDSGNQLSICDYDMDNAKIIHTSTQKIQLNDNDDEVILDSSVHWVTQTFYCNQQKRLRSFVVLTGYRDGGGSGAWTTRRSCLFWFDVENQTIVASYSLSQKSIFMQVQSLSNTDDGLVLAVAEKDSHSLRIRIVQVNLEQNQNQSDLTTLGQPHLIYTIPIHQQTTSILSSTMVSISMCSIPSSKNKFAFRYRLQIYNKNGDGGDGVPRYREFSSPVAETIGKIRSLLARNHWDTVDDMLASLTVTDVEELVNEPYADFHPSEAALQRLQALITTSSANNELNETLSHAQDCLRRLASGALTSVQGMNLFLEAIDCVTRSPMSLTMDKYVVGLSMVSSTIQNVVQALEEEHEISEKLHRKISKLGRQIAALQFLIKLMEENDPKECKAVLHLETPFYKIRSVGHLMGILIREHKFDWAETLYRTCINGISKEELTAEAIIPPILELKSDVKLESVASFICRVALPNLTINHPLLSRLKAWACRLADDLDDSTDGRSNKLENAIVLLKTIERGSRELQNKIHASFASFSPFAHYDGRQSRRSPRGNNSLESERLRLDHSNLSGEHSYMSGSSTTNTLRFGLHAFAEGQCIPTILELGLLKKGSAIGQFGSPDNIEYDDNYEEKEDCVRDKLREAVCLRDARNLGLEKEIISLRFFERKGGPQFVAKQLVALYSASVSSHDERLKVFADHLMPFCDAHNVSLDQAMFDCTVERCRGKNISECAIAECCSIARCCTSVIVRCHVVLTVLRAALLCDSVHSDLSQLASEAVSWASCDSNLQSELAEAARILQIDNIVVKYCGAGARELFRMDNPRHAIRLLEFVAKHIERETVVEDTLSLCDAFHHLSAQDAARSMMQQAILKNNPDRCITILSRIMKKDMSLAEISLVGSIAFVDEILSECSRATRCGCNFERLRRYRNQARQAAVSASSILLFAMDNGLQVSHKAFAEIDCNFITSEPSLKSLRDFFLRIEKLQREHLIFISLAESVTTKMALDISSQFVREVAICFATNEPLTVNRKLSIAKRVCNLLVGDCSHIHSQYVLAAVSSGVACELVREHKDDSLIDFLSSMGLLQNVGANNSLFANIHLSSAFALCLESADSFIQSDSNNKCMHRIIRAASLLSDCSLSMSEGKQLSTTVAFSGHLAVVLLLFSRMDGVGENLDKLRRNLLSRVWSVADNTFGIVPLDQTASQFKMILRSPALHSSWYIGDGLLLPPDETFTRCLRYCKGLVNANQGLNDGSIDIYQLSGGRGAHSIALRVLCTSAAIQGCSYVPPNDKSFQTQLLGALTETTKALAERSLGGTSTGITSSIIDSQLALCFLRHLPLKQAFHVYRSGIPNSLKTQNFSRLLSLANVGMLAVSGDSKLGREGLFAVGWQNQNRFFEQCKQLSAKATWWAILRRFGVDFDMHCFQEVVSSSESVHPTKQSTLGAYSKYASSLLPQLIAKISTALDVDNTLRVALLFAAMFGLPSDRVYECHVEFSLCPPECELNRQFDFTRCEKIVRASLRKLQTAQKRFSVLRKCIIALQGSELYARDYDRHILALSLYSEAITFLLERDPRVRSINSEQYELELDLIGRRKDALAILSSFFRGERRSLRPEFPKFFIPLPVEFDDSSPCILSQKMCGILGRHSDDEFDPIASLQQIISESLDSATVTALAPLCFPLGIPNGYMHARALLARFQHSRKFNVSYPSFESDVNPVLNRIRSPTDRAVLAEWCALQYQGEDQEKLKCLDVVLQDAIQAASDLEQRLHDSPQNKKLEELEARMHDTIKRVTAAKAKLSDLYKIKSVLSKSNASRNLSVDSLCSCLMKELESFSKGVEGPCPEKIVDFLYEKGSLLAANACLSKDESFSIHHLRSFCSVVHSACNAVADQNSHINLAAHARRLRERWLFFGDESKKVRGRESKQSSAHTPLLDIEEDDTINFVMDLSGIQNHGDEVAIIDGGIEVMVGKKIISEEEPSALFAKSAREISEYSSQRTALRIAFVMACGDECCAEHNTSKENGTSNGQSLQTKARLGLLKKLETKRNSKRDSAFELGNDLLQIVFASADKPSMAIFSRWTASDQDTVMRQSTPKTVTFSMRHRALRAASILCPQAILEEIVAKEGYFHGELQGRFSLRQCSFGTFLAKEIEEMGLPLPHSDILQLSSMNFLAYARALWRHHRDTNMTCKGRLLLLLLELSLKGDETNVAFISSLLEEMSRLNLSRSLLLSLEQISCNMDRFQQTGLSVGRDYVITLGQNIYRELSCHINTVENGSSWAKTSSEEFTAVVDTIQRLYKVITVLCDDEDASKFCRALTSLGNQELEVMLSQVVEEVMNGVNVSVRQDVEDHSQ